MQFTVCTVRDSDTVCFFTFRYYRIILGIHGSVHRRLLNRNTNKLQLCNGIYYSRVYWRLNMFQAAHRSSSRALNCIFSLWLVYPCGDQPLPRLSVKLIHGCKYSLELLMVSGMPLETCWAFNKRWNNKFYYNVASCWLFLLIHLWVPFYTSCSRSEEIELKRYDMIYLTAIG